ncbi:hypothetical protein [Pseudomonas aeruginosa]|uniref:hypothetical protein n=1 Tax=Pseudomonas aeruginosa TaxID=287 RepID=UPI0032B56D80
MVECVDMGMSPPPFPRKGAFTGSGNRCGHDPQRLAEERLSLPMPQSGFFLKIQRLLIEAAKHYYYTPKALLLLSNLSRKVNKDGTPRQNRSEGREGHSLLLAAILSMTDFASLRVGRPLADGSFRHASCDELARLCGLTRPSRDPARPEPVASGRFFRTLKQLKKAGAVTLYEQYEELEDGRKRARTAIKTVSENFLIVLGRLSFAEFRKFREECSAKLRKFRNKWRKANPQIDDVKRAERELLKEQQSRKLGWLNIPAKLKRKNQAPRQVEPLQQLQNDYAQHCLDVEAQIADRYPGVSIGLRDRLRLFSELGGMSWDAWLRRHSPTLSSTGDDER